MLFDAMISSDFVHAKMKQTPMHSKVLLSRWDHKLLLLFFILSPFSPMRQLFTLTILQFQQIIIPYKYIILPLNATPLDKRYLTKIITIRGNHGIFRFQITYFIKGIPNHPCILHKYSPCFFTFVHIYFVFK